MKIKVIDVPYHAKSQTQRAFAGNLFSDFAEYSKIIIERIEYDVRDISRVGIFILFDYVGFNLIFGTVWEHFLYLFH